MESPKVLVLYNFYDDPADETRRRNLKLFVDLGCSDGVQLIILRRGPSVYVDWLENTFTVIDVVNKGICINGYKHGIDFVMKQGIEFDFMVLMNDSMVGPFLKDQTSSWCDILIRALDDSGADAISPYMCPSSRRPLMMSGFIFLRRRCVPCLVTLFNNHVIDAVKKAKRMESKISVHLENNGFKIAGLHHGHWGDDHLLHNVVFDKGNRVGAVRSIVSKSTRISCVTETELNAAMKVAQRENIVQKEISDRISVIRQSSIQDLNNPDYVKSLILRAGINTERQGRPSSVSIRNGEGLRISLYPNQFSEYLMLLASLGVTSYIEVGCRWGGTFIFTMEYLRRLADGKVRGVSVDIIDSPVKTYCDREPDTEFVQADSTSDSFKTAMSGQRFDVVFIDGDHSYQGVKADYMTFSDKSDVFVFHDIVNSKCPGVVRFWQEIKTGPEFACHEFTEQYPDVLQKMNGQKFLGIGVAIRRS